MALGLGVSESEVVGYLIGIGVVACAMVVLGALVRTGWSTCCARTTAKARSR